MSLCSALWLCYLMSTLHSSSSHTAIITARGHDRQYRLSAPISTVHVTSALECAQTCSARGDCQGVMFLPGNLCAMYGERVCQCAKVSVSLSPEWPTRYHLGFSARPLGMQDASRICQQQGMTLLAITSQQEQEMVAQYIDSIRPVPVGCYRDRAERAMDGDSMASHSMTPMECWQYCNSKGFLYSATQYGQECYCDNDVSFDRYGPLPSSECNAACPGNDRLTCGGAYANFVSYANHDVCELIWSSGWTPTPASLTADWQWNITDTRSLPFSYHSWDGSQPRGINEQCMVLYGKYSYRWHDIPCSPRPNMCYICECETP